MGLKIYGCSDDLVEIEGHIREEVGCYGGCRGKGVEVTIGNKKHGGVSVRMDYAPGEVGVWTARISQLDEDVLIPWPIILTDGRVLPASRHANGGYSVVVEIDCPKDTPVTWKAVSR